MINEVYKIVFWNVARLINKDKEFWREMEEWDVISLCETWVDSKSGERVKDRLPKGYTWEMQYARRNNRKGRVMGGMIMGVKTNVKIGKGKR